VFFAGVDQPGVAASTDVAAMDAAAGTTYDVGGVATLLFDTATSMEDTFGVIVDNSPWNDDCETTDPIEFDDGVYRGVAGVFTGCNGGSGAVITLTVERIGSGKWMLMNVFVTSLADLDAAKRVLQTFDFLDAGGSTGTTDNPSGDPSAPPAVDSTAPSEGSFGETVPSTTDPSDSGEGFDDSMLPKAASLIGKIGTPDPDVFANKFVNEGFGVTYVYEHHVGEDTAFAWLAELPDRISCDYPVVGEPERWDEVNETWAYMSCVVDHDGGRWVVTVDVLAGTAGETTTVIVSPL
jgi:hypothetical protein